MPKPPERKFNVGDKVRVNLHHGRIEDAVVRAVIQEDDGTKLQVDVVGLDLTALIVIRGRLSSEIGLEQRGNCPGATSFCSLEIKI